MMSTNKSDDIPSPRVALITGGARRVGAATALELARQGMDIAITCLQSTAEAKITAAAIRDIGRRCLIITTDLARDDAAEVIDQALHEQYDRLDVLVNNASIFEPSPLETLSAAALDRQMAINARTPVLLMQRLAAKLGAHYHADQPASAGRIINFIDIHVMGQHLKGFMAYNMSKAALMEATMTAALDLAPKVTVNAIAPGVVAWAESYTPEARQAYMRRVPLARPGTPQDAAAAVKFLACDAHYSTGQIIKLDGGRFLT
jgi:pteridine reductase